MRRVALVRANPAQVAARTTALADGDDRVGEDQSRASIGPRTMAQMDIEIRTYRFEGRERGGVQPRSAGRCWPLPARDIADGTEVGVGLGPRVLLGDACAELDIGAHRLP